MKEYIKNNKDFIVLLFLAWVAVALTVISISLIGLKEEIRDVEASINDAGDEINAVGSELGPLEYLDHLDPKKDFWDAQVRNLLRERELLQESQN